MLASSSNLHRLVIFCWSFKWGQVVLYRHQRRAECKQSAEPKFLTKHGKNMIRTNIRCTAMMVAVSCVMVGLVAPAAAQNTNLLGKVEIDGSSTVYPISEAAASGFTKQYPNVKINVGVSGTGGGFKRFTKGETDISDASRPIKDSEFKAAKAKGVKFFEIPVAYDGLTLVVHKTNDWVDHLTVEEIKKIFRAKGGVETWSDVRAGWPDKKIQIYAPGTDSGTFDYFKEVVVGKDEGVSLRSDMSTSEDDNVLVTGVAGSASAIGFLRRCLL